MKDTYRYVIHAYEDVRQKRPMKHEHGGTTVLTDGARALERAELLAKESPMGGSTSTSSTEGRRSRWRPRRSIGRSGSASTRSPLPTGMAQGTDFGLYSPKCLEGVFSGVRQLFIPNSSLAPTMLPCTELARRRGKERQNHTNRIRIDDRAQLRRPESLPWVVGKAERLRG
jgi:hypothetical protein